MNSRWPCLNIVLVLFLLLPLTGCMPLFDLNLDVFLDNLLFAAEFCPDERFVVAATMSELLVVDVEDGAVLSRSEVFPGRYSVSLHPMLENDLVLAIQGDGIARAIRPTTGQAVYELQLEQARILSAAISHDGRRVATGHNDGRICLWNALDGCLLYTFGAEKQWINDLCFSPTDTELATVSNKGVLTVWTVNDGTELGSRATGAVSGFFRTPNVAWSADGRQLHVSSAKSQVRVYAWPTLKEIDCVEAGNAPLRSVARCRDRDLLVLRCKQTVPVLWDMNQKAVIQSFGDKEQCTLAVCISPDGTRVVTGSSDGLIVWDANTGELLRRIKTSTHPMFDSYAQVMVPKSDPPN